MNQEDKVIILRQLHELRDRGVENKILQEKHGRWHQANYWAGYIKAVGHMVSNILELSSVPAKTP